MTTSRMVWVISMVLGLIGCAFINLAYADGDQALLATVPKAAKDAAVAAVKGIKLTKAEAEQEGEHTVYELKGKADGTNYTVEVTEDGKNIKVEQEGDTDGEEATLATVPKAAKDAAVAAVKGIKLTEVEVEKEKDQTVYDFKGNTPSSLFHWGKEYSVRVTADGKVIKVVEQEEVEDEKD